MCVSSSFDLAIFPTRAFPEVERKRKALFHPLFPSEEKNKLHFFSFHPFLPNSCDVWRGMRRSSSHLSAPMRSKLRRRKENQHISPPLPPSFLRNRGSQPKSFSVGRKRVMVKQYCRTVVSTERNLL